MDALLAFPILLFQLLVLFTVDVCIIYHKRICLVALCIHFLNSWIWKHKLALSYCFFLYSDLVLLYKSWTVGNGHLRSNTYVPVLIPWVIIVISSQNTTHLCLMTTRVQGEGHSWYGSLAPSLRLVLFVLTPSIGGTNTVVTSCKGSLAIKSGRQHLLLPLSV